MKKNSKKTKPAGAKAPKAVKKTSAALPVVGSVQDDFFTSVYDVVRLIPKGRVTSYGAIAKYLGASRSARIVGYAMNAAHAQKPKVPAHRVVNSAGLLTGKHHFATPYEMEELLKKEKVLVNDNKVVNFSKHFWDPVVELAL